MSLTDDPQFALPSAQDMQSQLRQSGVLEQQGIRENPSGATGGSSLPPPPTGPIGVGSKNLTAPSPPTVEGIMTPGVALANTEVTDDEGFDTYGPLMHLKHWIPKALAVILTIQGLRGIYNSIAFIFVEFPLLEEALTRHELTREQVNGYASKAIITIISTIISMFFAMHLAFLKSKAAKIIHTVMGVLLVIGNQAISNYFSQLQASDVIASYSTSLLESVYLLFSQFLQSFGL